MPHSGTDDTSNGSTRGQVSRRDVITLIAGVGLGAGGTLLGYEVAGEDRSPADNDSTSWDQETDIVVLGFGAAGASVAIEAAQTGADVTVLEAAAEADAGGWAKQSDGLIYLGGGTAIQETMGAFDDPENYLAYLQLRYPDVPDARLESLANNSVDHYTWLQDELGLTLNGEPMETINRWRMDYNPGGGLNYSGAEFNMPFREETTSVQRGHKVPGEGKTGDQIYNALSTAATDAGAEVMYQTPAQRLVTDSDGAVQGVIAGGGDDEMAIRATGDVVIATNTWDMNESMIDQYAPQWSDAAGGFSGLELHNGAGIRMAQEAGASVEHMSQITADTHIAPATPQGEDMVHNRQLPRGMLMNGAGLRFVDESRPPSDIGKAIMEKADGTAYFVLSQPIVDKLGGHPERFEKLFSAGNYDQFLSTCVRRFGMSFDTLNGAFGGYNYDAQGGIDPSFGKPRRYLKPLWDAPIHLYDFTAETLGLEYETHGGLRTSVKGRVKDVDGNNLAGLRAAPGAANGITGINKDGGMRITEATWFGRVVGQAAAEAVPEGTSE